MREVSLHLSSIAAAVVVKMILGALWYSPVLFVKPWMQMTGVTHEQMRQRMPKGVAVDLIGAILTAFGMAYIVGYSGAQGIDAGLSIAFLVWLGFVAPSALASVLYEGKPWGLWLLNSGYWLISLMAMGAVLANWS
jgi:hypothetical protein